MTEIHHFHGRVRAEPAETAQELATRGQLDNEIATLAAANVAQNTAIAAATNRANHTGQQAATTISDLTAAIQAQLASFVGAAPTVLDTWAELVTQIQADQSGLAALTLSVNANTTNTAANTTRIEALEAVSVTAPFKQTIGNALLSAFTLTHNFGTTDVTFEVFTIADGQTVYPVIKRTGINTASIDFGTFVPALNSHRVIATKR